MSDTTIQRPSGSEAARSNMRQPALDPCPDCLRDMSDCQCDERGESGVPERCPVCREYACECEEG